MHLFYLIFRLNTGASTAALLTRLSGKHRSSHAPGQPDATKNRIPRLGRSVLRGERRLAPVPDDTVTLPL